MVTVPAAVVVAHARAWVGTPFRHLGRTRGGIDCLGLLLRVIEETGLVANVKVPDSEYLDRLCYDLKPADPQHNTRLAMFEFARAVPMLDTADPLAGDAVVCAGAGGTGRVHLGIVTPRTLIHASFHRGCVIEQPFAGPLQDALIAVFRCPGVIHEDGA